MLWGAQALRLHAVSIRTYSRTIGSFLPQTPRKESLPCHSCQTLPSHIKTTHADAPAACRQSEPGWGGSRVEKCAQVSAVPVSVSSTVASRLASSTVGDSCDPAGS